MERRAFLRQGSFAAAALGLAPFARGLAAAASVKRAQDRVTLGRSGLTVSRLAQGTGSDGFGHSSNQTRQLGLKGLADLLRAGVDQGLNFWDLADAYGSHPHAREALRSVKRDQVVIMTKSWARDEKGIRADLERYRRELGVEQIDLFMLHCLTDPDWPTKMAGPMAALSEAKQKGIIRAHGVSCHSFGALKAAAASDWVDVDLARLNFAGVAMDASVAQVVPVLADMKRKGKGVIGMKILGAGELTRRIDAALEYAVASPVLDCFTIGAESRSELDDLLERIPAAAARAAEQAA
jgi:aryl-alcohol dehydrogenase-like predicted oxidoreductase